MSSHSPATDPALVEPIDPLHDIDARKTVTWVILFTVGVFGSMWLLGASFGYFVSEEHRVKIAERETTERNAQRALEDAELTKTEDLGGGKQRISIDEAMRRLAVK